MPTPKYQQQYMDMVQNNQALFDQLKKTKRTSKDFKDIQMKVLRVVRRNEDALCKRTESTKFSGFSLGLADKFLQMVRSEYPEIDYA